MYYVLSINFVEARTSNCIFYPQQIRLFFSQTILGDASASMNASEAEVVARVHEAL